MNLSRFCCTRVSSVARTRTIASVLADHHNLAMSRIRRGLILNHRLLGYEKVEFTQHALSRMRQRKITRDDVFRTIEKPDQTGLPTAPKRQRVRWNKSINYSIDVVFELLPDRVQIVTTMRVCDALRGIAPTIVSIKKQPPRGTREKKRKFRR